MNYYAFISYSDKDKEWAIWLQHELEHYHLPASFNGRSDVRDNLREVFRDRNGLSAGLEWDKQVKPILKETTNLIVICSPNARESKPIEKEIKTFLASGKEDNIYPFIVEGDKPYECFPPSLKKSKVGGDVNKDGRDAAFIKIVAGMLNLEFPDLYNRYELEKAEQERKEREQKEKLQTAVGRFVGEKAMNLIEDGDSYLAAAVILEMYNSGMGLITPEVEKALRKALVNDKGILQHKDVLYATCNPNSKKIASMSPTIIKIWNLKNGALLGSEKRPNYYGNCKLLFIENGNKIINTTNVGFEIRDGLTAKKLSDGWSWKSTERPRHRPFIVDLIVDSKETFVVVGLNIGVHIVDLHIYEEICTIDDNYIPDFSEKRLTSLALSPDEAYIICLFQNGETYRWNLQERECELETGVHHCNNNPYSQHIVSLSQDTISVIGTEIQNSQSVTLCEERVSFFKYSPKGDRIITVTENGIIKKIQTRKANSFEIINELECNIGNTNSLAISPDGNNFFLVDGCNVYIVDASTKKIRSIEKGCPDYYFIGMVYSYSELKYRLYGHNGITENQIDDTIIVKAPYSDEVVTSIKTNNALKGFATDAKGRWIVTRSREGIITAYTLKDGNIVKPLGESFFQRINMLFTPDGKYFVGPVNKSTLGIWNTEKWELIHSNIPLDTPFFDCSSDSKYLIGGFVSGEIRIWDIETGVVVDSFKVEGNISSVKFNPNPEQESIAVLTTDGKLLLYQWKGVSKLIEEAQVRFSDRHLSNEEKRKYHI